MEKKAGIITVVWILLWAVHAFFIAEIPLPKLSLNEVGDFLAGVFAPLAFLWLIVGYMLQRKELQNNTNMLEMQKNEIKESREATQKLAEATIKLSTIDESRYLDEKQKAKENAQPRIDILEKKMYKDSEKVQGIYQITNRGAQATNIKTQLEKNLNMDEIKSPKVWKTNESFKIALEYKPSFVTKDILTIEYIDSFGEPNKVIYDVHCGGTNISIQERLPSIDK